MILRPTCELLSRCGWTNSRHLENGDTILNRSAQPNKSLDASGTTGLVIDNLSVTWLSPAASTQTLGNFHEPTERPAHYPSLSSGIAAALAEATRRRMGACLSANL